MTASVSSTGGRVRRRPRRTGAPATMPRMERVEGLEIPATLEEACRPERLALLVYDMQIGVLRQIEDGEGVTARVRQVLEAARAAGVRTVFLRHITMPRRLMGAAQLRMWKAWQRRESAADVVSEIGRAH